MAKSLQKYLSGALFMLLAGWKLLSAEAAASEPGTSKDTLKLQPLIHQLVQNNPQLKALEARWEASREQAAISGALPDPKFTFATFAAPVETRVGPQDVKFGVAQRFPWFGKLSASEQAAVKEAAAEEFVWWTASEKLAYMLSSAYIDAAYNSEAQSILEEEIKLTEAIKEAAEQIYGSATGKAEQGDVVRLSVMINRMRDRMINLKENQELSRNHIEQLIDSPLPPQPVFVLDEAAKGIPHLPSGLEQSFSIAQQQRPEYNLLEMKIEAAQLREKIARLDNRPDFTLGFDYTVVGEAHTSTRPPDSGEDAAMFFIALDIPIWRKKQSAQIRQTLAQTRQIRETRNDLDTQIRKELADVFRNLDAARDSIDLHERYLIPEAVRARDLALSTYATGRENFLDVLDTERAVLELKLNLLKAQADLARSQWKLLRSLGGLTAFAQGPQSHN